MEYEKYDKSFLIMCVYSLKFYKKKTYTTNVQVFVFMLVKYFRY